MARSTPSPSSSPRARRGAVIVLVGLGLIGRALARLVAALSQVGRMIVIDRDRYEESNRPTQFVLPEEVGQPKAQAVARELRRLRPALEVQGLVADVADVPWGWFRQADVILGALDSKRARCLVNEAAWRVGVPWIDAGVGQPAFARTRVFVPGPDQACYECQMSAADYAQDVVYACQPAGAPPATNSPAHLGALAAALQAAECAKLLAGELDQLLAGRELLWDGRTHQVLVTRFARRADCRFDHRTLAIRLLAQGPRGTTLAGALALGRRPVRGRDEAVLHVPGKRFAGRLVCGCGSVRTSLRLNGRWPAAQLKCAKCGGQMAPSGFHLRERLALSELSSREHRRSLAALGLAAGDVFGVSRNGKSSYFELATD